ncbi:MAG: hypothetical protein ACOZCL_08395 [Bacillota bacterium]
MGKDCRRERDFKIRNFPDNIKDLLCMLAKEDDVRVTIVLDTCEDCILENVEIVAVIGHLAVFRCHDKFKFVDIRCICEVIVDCDVILDEILDNSSRCHC